MTAAMVLQRIARYTRFTAGKLFGEYLAVTNTVASGGLMAAGDVVAQKVENFTSKDEIKKHDWKRTARLGIIGLTLGLPCHYWYVLLDRHLPGRASKTIIKKILLDQAIMSPFLATGYFVGSSLLEGNTLQKSVDTFKGKFLMVYAADCTFWPPAQFINFYVLPPYLRVTYVNTIAVIWDTFLSYMKHNDVSLHSKEDSVKLE